MSEAEILSAPGGKRLPSLDGLRGIAIIVVVMCHATDTSYAAPLLHSFSPLFNGFLAVRAFLLMSGYLITGLLLKEKEVTGRISLKRFYFRRIFRLLPVQASYIFSLFIISKITSYQISGCAIFTALTYVKNYACLGPADGHFWTLSVEEQFYLIWAFAFVTLSRKWLIVLAFGLIVISPFSRAIEYHGGNHNAWWLTSNADALMIGCLTAITFKEPWLRRMILYKPILGRACAIAIMAIPVVMTYNLIFGVFTVMFAPLVQDLCLSYLVCSWLLVKRGLSYEIVNLKIFIYAGTVSYSIYIWQQIFFYTSARDYGLPDYFFFHFPFNLVLALTVGMASFYLIERPMMSLRKRLSGPGHSAARDHDTADADGRFSGRAGVTTPLSVRPQVATTPPRSWS